MVKIIVVLTIVLIAAGLALGFITGFIPWKQQSLPDSGEQSTSTPSSQTTEPPTAPASSPTPSPEDVKFAFEITDISGSGLSRTITARITNTGSTDAHNVWAKAEAFSQGSRIKLGGQEYLRTDIGLLTAGESITTEVTLSLSVTDGLKISQNGVTFILTINSDEYIEKLSYDYMP